MTEHNEPEDQNVIIFFKIQRIILEKLGPKVADVFSTKLGPEWGAELNRRRSQPKNKRSTLDPMVLTPDGEADWDFSQLLDSIRNNIFEFKGTVTGNWDAAKAHCYYLKQHRNDVSHEKRESQALTDRKVLHYAENAVNLLRAFGLKTEADVVDGYAESIMKRAEVSEQPKPQRSQPIVEETSTPDTPDDNTRSPENVEDSRIEADSAAAKETEPLKASVSNRSKPLPAPGSGVV